MLSALVRSSAYSRRPYGEVMLGLTHDGTEVRAGVFNEHQVRAAAGLTMALGAVAFAYAYFAAFYLPIQVVTAVFFVDFLIRMIAGIGYSPTGLVARWMTQREAPHWVSAKPKRFAWSIGVVMSFAMTLITNGGIRGDVPLTICLMCLALMWMEAVLGLCLGCEIHRLLVRRGWVRHDEAFEICTHGSCAITPRRGGAAR
ncbi:hypothetical protein GCM10011504_48830 [Siccirubricoccus deserti]|uniref:DUF4395 domain-containing protein n=1 Tax=Siccirubricoccus deserti TaxID=2013562 RepID=A0A9X0UF52_9PROT|nr:DUF4395 domain-containing protein [Siccirubricoccus deserti]MBC4018387.1 DUF4395 domain-containing protein [Siccirubricoccus deserti]GGC65017.1 hypothetical protein GCM10011504_48830 [Siccirubricoccus deserti]